ncbi:MAG TPA: lasso peptide biosynthesis B2 protein [Pyrinomonadaceae bacterium]|jgi:hypothetical protein
MHSTAQEMTPALVAAMPKQVPSPPASPPQIREKQEGSLLLWVERGAMFSVNSIATIIWKRLEENLKGRTLAELVDWIEQQCQSSAGNDLTREEIARDLSALLEQLENRGVIKKRAQSDSGTVYRITKGVLRTSDNSADSEVSATNWLSSATIPEADKMILQSLRALVTPVFNDQSIGITALEQISEINRHSSKIDVAISLLAFLAYDIALKLLGFSRLCRVIQGWPLMKRERLNEQRLKRIFAGIERARIWYPKQMMCMQHSAVITCLSRYWGLPALMAVGARKMPFKSHAWVEVGGTVINDTQKVKRFYRLFAYY